MDRPHVTTAPLKPPVASIPAACQYLGGISRAGLYNLKNQLEWCKIGGRSFITIESLDALIAAGTIEAAK